MAVVHNKKHPLFKNLVMDTFFFERGGTKATNLVNKTKFTFYNGTSADAGPVWVNTLYGAGVQFDGSNDNVRMADPGDGSLDVGSGPMTIEAIIMPTNLANAEQCIVRKDPGGGNRGLYLFRVAQTTGKLEFQIGLVGTAFSSVTGNSGLPTDRFTHVTAVRDTANSRLRLYINGVPDNDAADAIGNSDNSGSPTIGAFFDDGAGNLNGAPFTGTILYVRIWKKALTQKDISSLNADPWQLYVKPTWLIQQGLASTPPPAGDVNRGYRMLLGVGL